MKFTKTSSMRRISALRVAAFAAAAVCFVLASVQPQSSAAASAPAYASIAAGSNHTCALRSDGTAWCWGDNAFGQLGDGTTTDRTSPVAVPGITNAIAIAAGGLDTTAAHTCALLATGAVNCWGSGASGQLGNGNVAPQLSPVLVSGSDRYTAIAAGARHTCAIQDEDAEVACWGENGEGQLGIGTTADASTPQVVTLPEGAISVDGGNDHTCAVLENGVVRCWGRNTNGQLGNGSLISSLIPVTVSFISTARSVSAGGAHSCVVLIDAFMGCWGAGQSGQLGNNGASDRVTPVEPVAQNQLMVSAGLLHTCAAAADSSLWCWGENGSGQVGNNQTQDAIGPVWLSSAPGGLTVAGGDAHTCALFEGGTIQCWGVNDHGQLGTGDTTPSLVPVAVGSFNFAGAQRIAAGTEHTCIVLASGQVHCWGRNNLGQLGDGTTFDGGPRPLPGFGDAIAVTAGGAHSCALRGGGTVVCWGANNRGQLGDGTTTGRFVATPIPNMFNVIAIDAGALHTCALIVRGAVYCWGAGDNGRIGDGTTDDETSPVQITAVSDAVAIAAGGDHTCALLRTGAAKCWGSNFLGQLGDGTFTGGLTPVDVSGLADAVEIDAGSAHTCARRITAADVVCWGDNLFGQLGTSTYPGPGVPAAIPGLPAIRSITTGHRHSCAITGGGKAYCWGDNARGQLGINNTTNQYAPVAMNAGPVSAVSGGGSHTCLLSDHENIPFCTGDDTYSQLGFTDLAMAVNPVPVLLDTDGDSCRDLNEVLDSYPNVGVPGFGTRDQLDIWDFFDVNGDADMDLQDPLQVLSRFGKLPGEAGYSALFDRQVVDPTQPWRPGPATGDNVGIDLSDVLVSLQSFGHECLGLPFPWNQL